MYKATLITSTGDAALDKRIVELTEQTFNTHGNDDPAKFYHRTTTLDGCFVWDDTDEGHNYWESLEAFTGELQVMITRVKAEGNNNEQA